jgi:hypothetical protein
MPFQRSKETKSAVSSGDAEQSKEGLHHEKVKGLLSKFGVRSGRTSFRIISLCSWTMDGLPAPPEDDNGRSRRETNRETEKQSIRCPPLVCVRFYIACRDRY